MSWLSSLLGTDYHAPVQAGQMFKNPMLAQLDDPNYGQAQLTQYATSAVNQALPSYLQNMQGTKEDNIRRGISTGDLGTSFENDLTSAFQKNIANSVAGQATNLFGQRNAMLFQGQEDAMDREQAARNNASQRKGSLISGLLGAGGMALGAFL